ncbi:unnamed protein product [Lactuca saligna]|uniref:Uncharacterized protein n=1 Tax=Lactuca saligna TaxID=75948 RepID=A0AA35YYS2_LACSI|nr:unnamed protein product [Lactuca saligna]
MGKEYGIIMRKAREVTINQVGSSRPVPTPTEVGGSNNDGTEVQLSEETMFGFHFENKEDEVQQKKNYDDLLMFLEDDESSGSHHPTSNLKTKRNKQPSVLRKEFLDLKVTIDKILIVVTSTQPPQTLAWSTLKSLEEKILALEAREKFMAECIWILI